MKKPPASIRTRNPGAMWPGPVATRFGSVSHEDLADGEGNKIAIFPTFEEGAAAQFYLWSTSRYAGKTVRAAIEMWSGHNSSAEYAADLAHHVPSLSLDTVITRDFLAGPLGLQFMKTQARWEAGEPYPMTDAQWAKGQELAFGPAAAPAPAASSPSSPTPAPSLFARVVSAVGALIPKKG